MHELPPSHCGDNWGRAHYFHDHTCVDLILDRSICRYINRCQMIDRFMSDSYKNQTLRKIGG